MKEVLPGSLNQMGSFHYLSCHQRLLLAGHISYLPIYHLSIPSRVTLDCSFVSISDSGPKDNILISTIKDSRVTIKMAN